MVDEPQGQGGLDGEIRVAPLPTPPAAPAGCPGSDRVRGQPHRHIAASNEGLIVGRPVRYPILRLIPGMNLRLHPRSVAPAESHEKCGLNCPTPAGSSCNNATHSRRVRLLTVIDEGNREGLEIAMGLSVPSQRVVRVLNELVAVHGGPADGQRATSEVKEAELLRADAVVSRTRRASPSGSTSSESHADHSHTGSEVVRSARTRLNRASYSRWKV